MRVETFFSVYDLYEDVQSILLDLIYSDQICGPSNEDEEWDMEHSAKLTVCSLLYKYADKSGEIEESNVDFEELYDSMHNALFNEFSRYGRDNHYDYDDLY